VLGEGPKPKVMDLSSVTVFIYFRILVGFPFAIRLIPKKPKKSEHLTSSGRILGITYTGVLDELVIKGT